MGYAWHHSYNTPENARKWIAELQAACPPDRVQKIVDDLEVALGHYGFLTSAQAALLKDLREEHT